MRPLVIFLVSSLATTPAAAETCKYVDDEGRIIYSNITVKRARKVTCFQAPVQPPESVVAPQPPPAMRTADPARPRIDPTTQRKRDQDRRTILEDELAREQKALDDAKRALAEQETLRSGEERNYSRVQERLKPFRDAISAHEKNIASIQQELATPR